MHPYPHGQPQPAPPPYPPGPPQNPQGFPPAGPPAAPPAKPKGGAQAKVGIVLLVLGVLPLLAGVGIEAQNISNAQQMIGNDDFTPKAWHNLEGGQIFPDYLTDKNTVRKIQGWSRQGIAEETTCTDALRKDFAQEVEVAGCQTVLRATYADFSGELAATLAVIVVDSHEEVTPLAQRWTASDSPGPLVQPVTFRDTPSETWRGKYAIAGGAMATGQSSSEAQYLLSISVGPIDGSRSVGELPEPWALQGQEEKMRYSDITTQLLGAFYGSLSWTMEGK